MKWLEKMFGCFHNWSTWSTPEIGELTYIWGSSHQVWIQKRICQKCGKIELEQVR